MRSLPVTLCLLLLFLTQAQAQVPTPEKILDIQATWSRFRITDSRGFNDVRIVGECRVENVSPETIKKLEFEIDIVNEHGVRFPASDPQSLYKLKSGRATNAQFVRQGLPTVGFDQKLAVMVTASWKDSKGGTHSIEVAGRELNY